LGSRQKQFFDDEDSAHPRWEHHQSDDADYFFAKMAAKLFSSSLSTRVVATPPLFPSVGQ